MQSDFPKSLQNSLQSLIISGDPSDISIQKVDTVGTAVRRQSGGSRNYLWMNLPPELLVEIFRHTIIGPKAPSPLELGWVCRFWRDLVFNSCQLWSQIELQLVPSLYDNQLSLLEKWLERAKGASLSLVISSNLGRRAEYGRLISIIGSKSNQISTMDLYLPRAFFNQLSETRTSFGSLTQLLISTNDEESFDLFGGPTIRTFEPSLDLTNASIRRFYVSSFSLPWAQLLHLHLSTVAPYEICEAILWSHNLQSLHAEFVVEAANAEEITLPQTITHKNLQRFTFSETEEVSFACAIQAFDQLRLIELKEFTFILGTYRTTFLLQPFVSASMFPLEELSIQEACITESDLIACLKILPSLRVLDLANLAWSNNASLGPELFELMTLIPCGSSPILPNLRSFMFQGSKVAFSPDVVVELLESRWGSLRAGSHPGVQNSPLQLIFLYALKGPHWVITTTHQLMFERWRAKGFSIAVTITSPTHGSETN